jgi:hypothetical protein
MHGIAGASFLKPKVRGNMFVSLAGTTWDSKKKIPKGTPVNFIAGMSEVSTLSSMDLSALTRKSTGLFLLSVCVLENSFGLIFSN